jgi:hypothetical protein
MFILTQHIESTHTFFIHYLLNLKTGELLSDTGVILLDHLSVVRQKGLLIRVKLGLVYEILGFGGALGVIILIESYYEYELEPVCRFS